MISTLHNISNRPFSELEKELIKFAKERPIELILPSLYSELEGPALKNIVNTLSKNKFLSYVTVGLDKANKSQFKDAKKFFKKGLQFDPDHKKIKISWKQVRSVEREAITKLLSSEEIDAFVNSFDSVHFVDDGQNEKAIPKSKSRISRAKAMSSTE